MDAIDQKILEKLQENAKLTNKELAAVLGLSITPVYERIKKMEREGIIRRYVALVSPDKVDKKLLGFCMVKLEKHTTLLLKAFEQAMQNIPEVMECYHMAGPSDYLLKLQVKDMNAYQQFIVKKLAALENVGHVESSFSMSVIKHTTAIHLP